MSERPRKAARRRARLLRRAIRKLNQSADLLSTTWGISAYRYYAPLLDRAGALKPQLREIEKYLDALPPLNTD